MLKNSRISYHSLRALVNADKVVIKEMLDLAEMSFFSVMAYEPARVTTLQGINGTHLYFGSAEAAHKYVRRNNPLCQVQVWDIASQDD